MPTLRHEDRIRQHRPRAVPTSMMTTGQIRPDKTRVRSHPLWDVIHDGDLDLKATQTNESHSPNDQDRGL
jgi:hypothetical protein